MCDNKRRDMQIIARELVVANEETIKSIPDKVTVLFEDGVSVETTKRKILYSWYFWEIHRQYPNTPIYSTHHVESVLKGGTLNSATHRNLLSAIYKDVVHTYKLYNNANVEHLLGLVYSITNSVHNYISKEAEANVTTIDILDFIEVIEHPIIKATNEAIEPNNASIGRAYAKILDVIKTDQSLKNNSLAKAVRAGMVNANQVTQCISVRGFMTEVDGTIMPTPIFSNFTKGMKTVYNYIAESRSAAKSYYFAEAPLEDSEYFARRLQLLCMTVERLHHEDCGSTDYIDWFVNPPKKNDKGVTIYPGDLKFMIGKYYLDDNTKQLKIITHDDPSLHCKTLKLRSVINCRHPDKHGVCEVCFGNLGRNVSRFANLGHVCCATMTQQTSQSVLSIKHYDASASGVGIVLSPITSRYFTVDSKKTSYIFKKELQKENVKITVNRDEAIGLTDILNVNSLDNINVNRVSSIDSIEICTTDPTHGEFRNFVTVGQEGRTAILTKEFLEFLRMVRWTTDARNNFVFDLDGWDFNQPIMKLPEMEYSFADHSKQIASVIESSMKNITNRSTPQSAISTLMELFELVNSKLSVNLAALEVIIYATMVKSQDSSDMGRNSGENSLGIADAIIKNRSLSTAYAYEDIYDTLIDPKSFFKQDRPDSPFDVAIAPKEVVERYKGIDKRYVST